VTDYKYAAVDLSIKLILYMPLVSGLSMLVYKTCLYFLPRPSSSLSTPEATLITFLFAMLIADLVVFLSHYLMQAVPSLWHFHQVHHSAEVLTPITVYRIHPVEDAVNGILSAAVSALVASTYTVLSNQDVSPFALFGVDIISLSFFLFGNALRHSHIWLSYGPWLSWIFISPAQHQIHHSIDPKHWNKNYGYMFAIWDACIGTLYIPHCYEPLRYGLPDVDRADFSSVPKLYFLPFLKAFHGLMPAYRQRKHPSSSLTRSVQLNEGQLIALSTRHNRECKHAQFGNYLDSH
jgi:sterol desaturase/sphingolipid hydroxylase (fatty acid hydroxylase superfamily)